MTFSEFPLFAAPAQKFVFREGTYVPTSPARIAIIGEAWGKQEALVRQPFQGASGQELRSILRQCNIDPDECIITNVVNAQPPNNNFEFFCQKEKPDVVPFNIPVSPGLYLRPEYWQQVFDLAKEVANVNLIIALGNTATWAVTQRPAKISTIRGTFYRSALGPKAISTWHPAAMLREYRLRPQMFADLTKAAAGQFDRDFTRPKRTIKVVQTHADVTQAFSELCLHDRYAIDIETCEVNGVYQISCIGFAPSVELAYVFPFISVINRKRVSYWQSLADELHAWEAVRLLCSSDSVKIFQNKLFDIFVLWRVARIPVLDPTEDTMFRQHATYPELPKSLAFLGSVFTDEIAWKRDRPKGGITGKAEE